MMSHSHELEGCEDCSRLTLESARAYAMTFADKRHRIYHGYNSSFDMKNTRPDACILGERDGFYSYGVRPMSDERLVA